MTERHKHKTARKRGFKTFRAPEELLDRLEKRSMMETVRTGVDVSGADIIRRGLEMVLDTPLPGKEPDRLDRPCLIVDTVGGGRRCLSCKAEGHAGEDISCGKDGEVMSL